MERSRSDRTVPVQSSGILLDPVTSQVTIDGNSVTLLPTECRLLAFLMKHEGCHYKAKALYREIWGMDDNGNIRTVLVHMHNLRRKVEKDPENPVHLLNIRGKGYTFHA